MTEKQLAKVKTVLLSAYERIPYYHHILENINIESMSVDEFKKIPVLEKMQYKEKYTEMLPKKIDSDSFLYETTSGSTGVPIKIPRTKLDRIKLCLPLLKYRHKWLNEIPNVNKGAHFSHRVNDVTENNNSGWLGLWLKDMSDESFRIQCQKLIEYKPQMLAGPPQALEKLSEYILKKSIDIDKTGIKLIECRAEYLFEEQRRKCEQAFKCPVVNMYGCHEAWGVAYECEEHKLHVIEDSVYLEILDEEGNLLEDGQCGDVVITSLCNQTVPFIRYRLGDKAILHSKKCLCGETEKYIDLVGCRSCDFVSTVTGKACSTIFLPIVNKLLEEEYSEINQFQIIQNGLNSFSLNIVSEKRIDNHIVRNLGDIFNRILGHSVNLTISINGPMYSNKNSQKMSWFYNKIDN